jgi:hypothetical protein
MANYAPCVCQYGGLHPPYARCGWVRCSKMPPSCYCGKSALSANEGTSGSAGSMSWKTLRSVEAKITRLAHEIAEIDKLFYGINAENDRVLHASMLERKRDDMVRGAVLQLHTAIEDVLNAQIIGRVLNVKPQDRSSKMRSKSGRALRKMLFDAGSLGFDMKLNFAVALGLLTESTQQKLMELNTLRNKCSHNWLLKMPVRHRRRPRQKKPPLLLYRGHDLHNVSVLEGFAAEFGRIYTKMFIDYLD